MHSITVWKNAPRPNYIINEDKEYPYSEVPFIGQYKLLRTPPALDEIVDHVDYWGEGRIVSQQGVSGFPSCYNVNHTYQLVSNGPDRNKKIPNRIPVVSYTNCDTSAYIRNNSVATVTIMGSPINSSCAADIARIIHNELGKVITYGFERNSKDIQNLTTELENKSLYFYPGYSLPTNLQGLSLFDNHMAFINITMLKDELFKLVNNGSYDEAVNLTKQLDNKKNAAAINDVIQKLLNSNSTANCKLMSFAYKLWTSEAQNIVQSYLPSPFKLILGQENVAIVNYGYQQALKLDANLDRYNDRLAWGHNGNITGGRVSWNCVPVWLKNDVTFKLHNVEHNMYLKLDVTVDSYGDRKVWGSTNSNEERHRYYIEPYMKDRNLVFFIINYQYRQGLKLDVSVDFYGDRVLWGHNGDIYKDEDRFKWTFSAWQP